jgi:hypothetical protein
MKEAVAALNEGLMLVRDTIADSAAFLPDVQKGR